LIYSHPNDSPICKQELATTPISIPKTCIECFRTLLCEQNNIILSKTPNSPSISTAEELSFDGHFTAEGRNSRVVLATFRSFLKNAGVSQWVQDPLLFSRKMLE